MFLMFSLRLKIKFWSKIYFTKLDFYLVNFILTNFVLFFSTDSIRYLFEIVSYSIEKLTDLFTYTLYICLFFILTNYTLNFFETTMHELNTSLFNISRNTCKFFNDATSKLKIFFASKLYSSKLNITITFFTFLNKTDVSVLKYVSVTIDYFEELHSYVWERFFIF